jgi:hypothetical protein
MDYYDIDIEWSSVNHITAQCRQFPAIEYQCFGHSVPVVLNKLIQLISNDRNTNFLCKLTLYFKSSEHKKTCRDVVYVDSDYEMVGDELWDVYLQNDCDIITFQINLCPVKKLKESSEFTKSSFQFMPYRNDICKILGDSNYSEMRIHDSHANNLHGKTSQLCEAIIADHVSGLLNNSYLLKEKEIIVNSPTEEETLAVESYMSKINGVDFFCDLKGWG